LCLVRETEARLLAIGQPVVALAQAAQAGLQSTKQLAQPNSTPCAWPRGCMRP
jgi:hypothetical protein